MSDSLDLLSTFNSDDLRSDFSGMLDKEDIAIVGWDALCDDATICGCVTDCDCVTV